MNPEDEISEERYIVERGPGGLTFTMISPANGIKIQKNDVVLESKPVASSDVLAKTSGN